jgi:hypothetical protein
VTLAPGDDTRSWLAAVAEGQCLVAGREIGFLGLLGQVYGLVGQYYRHFADPRERRGMTPGNYVAAAAFVPVCLAGVPLGMSLLSYFGTSALSRILRHSLRRSEAPGAALPWLPEGIRPSLETEGGAADLP